MKKYYWLLLIGVILSFMFSIGNVLAYSKDKSMDNSKVYVDIKGEVKNPGVYEVSTDMIVNQVIEKAGGLTKNADTEYLNLSKRVKDEMVIIIYSKKEITTVKKQEQKILNKTKTENKKVVTDEREDGKDEIEKNEDLESNEIIEESIDDEVKEDNIVEDNEIKEDNVAKDNEVKTEDEIKEDNEGKEVEKESKEEPKQEQKEEIKIENTTDTKKLTEVKGKSTGIDVSKYQGNIDFEKLKKSGLDFVMIRVGYRGYGTGEIKEDAYFEKNIKGAIKAGLKVGVYFFSVAITKKEALEEAKFTVDKIKDYDITYPVAIDYETFNERAKKLTNERRTNYVIAFLDYIEKKGYQGMFYSYKSAFENKFQMERLQKYKIWLAHFVSKTNYKNKYDMWQYTSKGKVSGIKGNVDMNVAYFKYV